MMVKAFLKVKYINSDTNGDDWYASKSDDGGLL